MDAYMLTKAESEELYSLVQAEFSDRKLLTTKVVLYEIEIDLVEQALQMLLDSRNDDLAEVGDVDDDEKAAIEDDIAIIENLLARC